MVKVSIRDYMPPYTTWMQVELEDGVCNGSPDIANPNDVKHGQIKSQNINENFSGSSFNDRTDDWDHTNL